MTVLILLMVTAIVAAGIPAARNAYENVVLVSNAETVLSTTVSALRNELKTASNVTDSENESVSYYNRLTNSQSILKLDTGASPETIIVQHYAKPDFIIEGETFVAGQAERLVSESASDTDFKLYPYYEEVNVENGLVTFTGLEVRRDLGKGDNDPVLASLSEPLTIRIIS